MQTLSELCGDFFGKFQLNAWRQKVVTESDKQCFENALRVFLGSGEREDAYDVYFCFCEIFNVFGKGYANTKKLLEMLSDHEFHSGELLAKHRDHYSHSAYVFAIGLAIYAHDAIFRRAFNDFYGYNDEEAPTAFLKYWGMAALFHDIGYPFQLAHEQIKTYCSEIWGKQEKGLYVSYGDLDKFVAFDDNLKDMLRKAFHAEFSSLNGLLSYGLAKRMGYDASAVEKLLRDRVVCPPEYMDHAYFSAVILAKQLFSVPGFEMSDEYLDVLIGILLHNSVNKMEIPDRRPVAVSDHPLAYLLILCDELQSWDRMAYGKISKRDPIAWAVRFDIDDGKMSAKYIFDSYSKQEYDEKSGEFKTEFNKNYAETRSGEFVEKIVGTAHCAHPSSPNKSYVGFIVPSTELTVQTEEIKKQDRSANPFLSDSTFLNLYDLAKLIHASYSEQYRGVDAVDEDFGALPLEYKLSNIALAKSYARKLEQINCFYSSKDLDLPIVTDANCLPYSNYKDNVESLCRSEHARWVKAKLALGWRYGTDYSSVEERDRKRIHKCIVPYEQLSEEEKSKDLLMINGIFSQLRKLESRVKIYNYNLVRKPKLEIAGVGHRDIDSSSDALKKQVKNILREYQKDHHVIVRTCFARGADQLIAECALELGIDLKADIPLEYEAFIEDVKEDSLQNGWSFTPDDELHMRHLLAQTVVCKTIADPVRKYEAASRYIIEKCDVLIALWDGNEKPLFDEAHNPINRGGTYDSVRIAKELKKTVRVIPCRQNANPV